MNAPTSEQGIRRRNWFYRMWCALLDHRGISVRAVEGKWICKACGGEVHFDV